MSLVHGFWGGFVSALIVVAVINRVSALGMVAGPVDKVLGIVPAPKV